MNVNIFFADKGIVTLKNNYFFEELMLNFQEKLHHLFINQYHCPDLVSFIYLLNAECLCS